jgi:hypothetical protein
MLWMIPSSSLLDAAMSDFQSLRLLLIASWYYKDESAGMLVDDSCLFANNHHLQSVERRGLQPAEKMTKIHYL